MSTIIIMLVTDLAMVSLKRHLTVLKFKYDIKHICKYVFISYEYTVYVEN